MQITDILTEAGGVQAMARELGISESNAARGAAALAPAILGGFKKHAQAQPAGLEALGGLLGEMGGGGLLDDVLSPQPTNVNRGNDILGQIFGSMDVSRTVAQNASSQSGVDAGIVKKMLPMVAMMIAGYMSTQHRAGSPAQTPAAGGLAGVLGGLLGRSEGAGPSGLDGLASMLDMNNDGNPLDDILGMASRRR